jgi:Mitochondrial K+-H+ exchange-related
MDVFVIPIGHDRYELYCEQPDEPEKVDAEEPPRGLLGKLRHRFTAMLKAAEERRLRDHAVEEEPKGWLGRMQDRMMAWVVERIAEQRLLWNLRSQTAVTAAHPQDMSFDQVMTLIKRRLKRDYDRHRVWLVIDTLGLVASGAVMMVPGPNVLAYYFTFRVVGHWLSMRGASQGMNRVTWTSRPCPPLGELRDVAALDPHARDLRVHEIAARLRLQHLANFFSRVIPTEARS